MVANAILVAHCICITVFVYNCIVTNVCVCVCVCVNACVCVCVCVVCCNKIHSLFALGAWAKEASSEEYT
jgi:hypothetical protein